MDNNTADKVRKAAQDYFSENNEIFAYYDDCFEDGNFKKITKLIEEYKNDNPLYVIKDYISSLYESYGDYYYKEEDKEIAKAVAEVTDLDYDEIIEDDEFLDIVNEERYYTPPYDHYLDQEVCMNLVIDSGDADYDFSSNGCIPPHYNGDLDYWNTEQCRAASILWFIDKQGGNRDDFKKFLEWELDDNDDVVNNPCPFKENTWEYELYNSCFDELNNCGSHLNELTFLFKTTVREWADMIENIREGKSITIEAGTTVGLFDEWSGGGSILELPMIKNIKVKPSEVFKFSPDVTFHYNVHDVYAVNDKLWEIGSPWKPKKEKEEEKKSDTKKNETISEQQTADSKSAKDVSNDIAKILSNSGLSNSKLIDIVNDIKMQLVAKEQVSENSR